MPISISRHAFNNSLGSQHTTGYRYEWSKYLSNTIEEWEDGWWHSNLSLKFEDFEKLDCEL